MAQLGSFDWNAAEGKITWSDELYRIFGFEPQSFEVTTEKYYQCVHPDDLDHVKFNLKSIQEGKKTLDFEYRIVRPDGSVRYLRGIRGIRGVELDREGAFKRLYGLLQDVTDLKQTTIDLKKKETAISHAAIPLVFTDLDGFITEVNYAFVNMWGYDNKKELIGKNNAELSSTKKEIAEIMKALRKDGKWSGEATARKKDGTDFDVFVSTEVILNENKDPDCLLASFIDISKLKQAESINRGITKIVEESLNEIYIFDATSLKFTRVNKGARQNLGYSLEEIRQLTPIDIKPEFSKKFFLELIKPLASGEQEKLLFETVHERKDKTTYPVEVQLLLAKNHLMSVEN